MCHNFCLHTQDNRLARTSFAPPFRPRGGVPDAPTPTDARPVPARVREEGPPAPGAGVRRQSARRRRRRREGEEGGPTRVLTSLLPAETHRRRTPVSSALHSAAPSRGLLMRLLFFLPSRSLHYPSQDLPFALYSLDALGAPPQAPRSEYHRWSPLRLEWNPAKAPLEISLDPVKENL